jgi:AcrR family transcriptional regulator
MQTVTGGYLKGRIRRDDIIVAARAVYAEAGYHGSSLREIAKRAGITHAGLIYHFPSKEALLAAVLERRDADNVELLGLAIAPGLNFLRHMVDLAGHNVQNQKLMDLYVRLAAEAVAADHPAHEYFEEHYRMARDHAVASFAVLAERGELRTGIDPAYAGLSFVALMDGLQVQFLSNPDRVDLVAAVRFYLESLLTVAL